MTDFKDIKAGDYARVTETIVNEGEVVEVRDDDTLVFKGGRWIDTEEYGNHHSVTVEVIERPREIGWWEVDHTFAQGKCATLWDGTCWNWSHGEPVLQPECIHPLHYIGKGSQ